MDESKDTQVPQTSEEIIETEDIKDAEDIADGTETVAAEAAEEIADVADTAGAEDGAEPVDVTEPVQPEKKTKYAARHARKGSGSNIRTVVSTIIIVVFACAIAFGLFKLWSWYTDNQSSGNQKNEARSHVTVISEPQTVDGVEVVSVKYDIDFDGLKEMNPDTVAWLKVEGTEIEYPVVQASDNSYYLTHSYDGSYNNAGWPFADYKDKVDGTDQNLVIYGHNRRDNSMFGSLHNAFNEDWQTNESNRYIVLVTENEYSIYEVFSVYSVLVENYYITTSFGTDEEFSEFLDTVKSRSVYDFGVELNTNDKILTLSTCSNMDAHRAVLHAKKVSSVGITK